MNIPLLFSQPLGLLLIRAWVKAFGTLRAKERYDVLRRQPYAYGLFRATEVAKFFGKSQVTVCEFGIAAGDGLLNMAALCNLISEETKIGFRIVGFDTGEGLPEIEGYKDHPEIWSAGDFTMPSRDELVKKMDGRAEIIFGDIKDTVKPFLNDLNQNAPLGFIAVDVDTYSGAKSVLRCLTGPPELYNPAVSIYCDDISFFFANDWCGELAAVREFNAENAMRKIDRDRSLPGTRPVRSRGWHQHMFICHILDHQARNVTPRKGKLTIEEHNIYMQNSFIY